MNPKEAILKIRALFEDMPEPMPEDEKEVKVEMAEYVLEDGTKVMISSLEVGGEVVLEDGSPAPDGEHKLADGQVIETEGGKIMEIKVGEEPVEIEIEAGNKMDEKMGEMEDKLAALEQENADLKSKLAEFEKKAAQGFAQVIELIEEIAKVPQADPIEKTQSFKFESTKDIKFDRLAKYRNAILNNKN